MSSSFAPQTLTIRRLGFDDIAHALSVGWSRFVAERQAAVSYALIFAVLGGVILFCIEYFAFAPMALPAAGGFMLVGPMLLCGYFALVDSRERNELPTLGVALAGFRQATGALWALGLVCGLLFMIWITDAATLYGFMIGQVPASLMAFKPSPDKVLPFLLWSSVMGAVLAFVIYAISAFAVPLLYYRRANLVSAIVCSVKAVFGNFVVMMTWALLISSLTIVSILVLPVFLIVFPVLAYASREIYLAAFPEDRG